MLINVTGTLAVLTIVIASLLLGILGSGDRIRANYSKEQPGDSSIRSEWAIKVFLMGFPSLVVSLIVSLITKSCITIL